MEHDTQKDEGLSGLLVEAVLQLFVFIVLEVAIEDYPIIIWFKLHFKSPTIKIDSIG